MGCSTSRPLTLALPLIGKITNEGAWTICADETAIGGTTTSMVSGAVIEYAANWSMVMVT